jgi:hypothetical protein
MGFGTLSIMGATPAALVGVSGNNAHWFNSHQIVFQDYTSGAVLKTYDTGTLAVATVDTSGGNTVGGGASVWAAWLSGVGVRTSVGGLGPFPAGGTADVSAEPTLVSETGQTLFITNFATASGLSCYSVLGVLQCSIATTLTSTVIHIRQNIISYQDASGWHLVNALTGAAVPGFLQRPNVVKLTPFTIGSSVGVMEYQSGTNLLTIRLATSLTGLTIPTVGTEFNPDVQGVDSTHVRVAYSLTSGEAPADLIILDIDTATGTTSRGTVVSGAVVFATGPTLAGSTFAGSTAPGNRLPVQSVKVLNSVGELSKPWRDALQGVSSSVQSAQTSINNLPTPTAPVPSFGTVGGVMAGIPGDVETFSSVDGSLTITPNQATRNVDFSVRSAASQWIPLVTGAEPPVFVTDGAGHLVLVSYP